MTVMVELSDKNFNGLNENMNSMRKEIKDM